MARQLTIDKRHNFYEVFDSDTGFYVRSGVLEPDETGKWVDTGADPFMRSFPSLVDVGVMGHCRHGATGLCVASGVQCYQDGLNKHVPNMSLANFQRITEECKGKVHQFALGGRGDPDQHEHFEDLLTICRENGIVPNFTTSGLGLDKRKVELAARLCGAVAVSWYRHNHTLRAIKQLLSAGVKTNVHYVLGNNSIDEAIHLLENDGFPAGINAVIFLLHKPVGLGRRDNVLSLADSRVEQFFNLIDGKRFVFKVGFDSCTVPGLLRFARHIDYASFDTCEAARWSMYVTPDMKALPCSFDQDLRWAYDISNDTIQNAWTSPLFDSFRQGFRDACPGCPKRQHCLGGCPLTPEIVLCDDKNCEEATV